MKKIVVLIALIALFGCKKELTFDEYWDCQKTYNAAVDNAEAQYNAHKINATAYANLLSAAKDNYEQCLAEQEADK